MSDGGLVSFTVAWERPDAFSKAISHVGSYTRLRGGSQYPHLIRKTRGNPKPIRVFLQDRENDINLVEGNWTLANLQMDSALMSARYDYRFEMGTGGHDLKHGGADYAMPQGTPVLAVDDAVVALTGEFFFSGNAVFLDHGNGLISMYFHLHEAFVEQGEEVSRGRLIGTVGSTGRSTGPHLHFGIRWQGSRVDPTLMLGRTEAIQTVP